MQPKTERRPRNGRHRVSFPLIILVLLLNPAIGCSRNTAGLRANDDGTAVMPSADLTTPKPTPTLQIPSASSASDPVNTAPRAAIPLPRGWQWAMDPSPIDQPAPQINPPSQLYRLRHPDAADQEFVLTVMAMPHDNLSPATMRSAVAQRLQGMPGITVTDTGIVGIPSSDLLSASFVRYEGQLQSSDERFAAVQVMVATAHSKDRYIVTAAAAHSYADLVYDLAVEVVTSLEVD